VYDDDDDVVAERDKPPVARTLHLVRVCDDDDGAAVGR
jgi:hypothetical protein